MEMYRTSKWGDVSEDFLLKKKKRASLCKVFAEIAMLSLILSIIDYVLLMLTLKGVLSLGLDKKLLLMVFFLLLGIALVCFIVWLSVYFLCGVSGTKQALMEAREQEIQRRENAGKAKKKKRRKKIQHDSGKADSDDEAPKEESEGYQEKDKEVYDDPEDGWDEDGWDDEGLGSEDNSPEDFSSEEDEYGDSPDENKLIEDGEDETEYMGNEEDAEDEEADGTFWDEGSYSDDEPEEENDDPDQAESIKDKNPAMNEAREESNVIKEEKKPEPEFKPSYVSVSPRTEIAKWDGQNFEMFWDGLKVNIMSYLQDNYEKIAQIEAERDKAIFERDAALEKLNEETALRSEAETKLEQALKELQDAGTLLNESSDFISIELIPPAEIVGLNMDIKIMTNKSANTDGAE